MGLGRASRTPMMWRPVVPAATKRAAADIDRASDPFREAARSRVPGLSRSRGSQFTPMAAHLEYVRPWEGPDAIDRRVADRLRRYIRLDIATGSSE